MKKEKHNSEKQIRQRVVRNIFFVYLFTSAVAGRYHIFSALCASFPFIFPIYFSREDADRTDFILHSLMYGTAGVIASALFMLVTDSYSAAVLAVPPVYGLLLCIIFSAVKDKVSSNKRALLKCIIAVSVCLAAFLM